MRCTSPRTVGFQSDGKTLCWSPKHYSKEYATFQLPCGKCLSCRLESARQTAVRCMHEASLHENNSFITLTYSDEHLKSERLQYEDWQKFVKKLRAHIHQGLLSELFPGLPQEQQRKLFSSLPKVSRSQWLYKTRVSTLQTGEYGDRTKRPHWHAIIFNWRPSDQAFHRLSDRGDRIYKSKTLDTLWGKNDPTTRPCEIGEVTFESAGYVARYATKKLTHGNDGEHDFNPIHKRSTSQAIGKKWIEKYWPDLFNYGYCVMPDGNKCGIPRYYERWLKDNKPEEYFRYVTQVKSKIVADAIEKENKITKEEKLTNLRRSARDGYLAKLQVTKNKARRTILEQKFKQLSKHSKES